MTFQGKYKGVGNTVTKYPNRKIVITPKVSELKLKKVDTDIYLAEITYLNSLPIESFEILLTRVGKHKIVSGNSGLDTLTLVDNNLIHTFTAPVDGTNGKIEAGKIIYVKN